MASDIVDVIVDLVVLSCCDFTESSFVESVTFSLDSNHRDLVE